MKQLANYINNIDSGLAIKLNAFYKLLDGLALTHRLEKPDVVAVYWRLMMVRVVRWQRCKIEVIR